MYYKLLKFDNPMIVMAGQVRSHGGGWGHGPLAKCLCPPLTTSQYLKKNDITSHGKSQ